MLDFTNLSTYHIKTWNLYCYNTDPRTLHVGMCHLCHNNIRTYAFIMLLFIVINLSCLNLKLIKF